MKNFKIFLLTLIAVGVGTATFVSAGHHYHGHFMIKSDMKDMDANQDGLLTLDEFSALQMQKMKSYFKMLDTNNDEVVSDEEWQAFVSAHSYGYDSSQSENIQ